MQRRGSAHSPYFNPATLPAFSFVVPNECNDMHTLPTNDQCPMWNGSTNTAANAVKMGDNWLAAFVPAVAQVATVILTWDEGTPSNEQVATVTYGAGVVPGRDGTAYGHASLEAGLYSYYGLRDPRRAAARRRHRCPFRSIATPGRLRRWGGNCSTAISMPVHRRSRNQQIAVLPSGGRQSGASPQRG